MEEWTAGESTTENNESMICFDMGQETYLDDKPNTPQYHNYTDNAMH